MKKMMRFTDYNSRRPIHIIPEKFVAFQEVFAHNAKPEDKPRGVLIYADGDVTFEVSETYGQVVNELLSHGWEI